MQAVMETVFDAAYLTVILILGVFIIRKSNGVRQYLMFGIMAVVLGGGDAFHLVPRAAALLTTGLENHAAALGIGKLITSITMTAFYLLLYYVWRLRYRVNGHHGLSTLMILLSSARVILCLMPQNAWRSPSAPLAWGIYRNIPFVLMGLILILLFVKSVKSKGDDPFRLMALSISLSFLFYLPVVIFADVYPVVGVLMIPKTLVYVNMVMIGYRAMKKESTT